jgi:hypothetical protein
MVKFDTQYFLEWFDKHDEELLVMEPEEIARKAFLAGMEVAQQSVEPTRPNVGAGDDFGYMLSQQIRKK